jgi:hypothetical protein
MTKPATACGFPDKEEALQMSKLSFVRPPPQHRFPKTCFGWSWHTRGQDNSSALLQTCNKKHGTSVFCFGSPGLQHVAARLANLLTTRRLGHPQYCLWRICLNRAHSNFEFAGVFGFANRRCLATCKQPAIQALFARAARKDTRSLRQRCRLVQHITILLLELDALKPCGGCPKRPCTRDPAMP